MLEVMNALAWVSRAKTCYDLTQAKSADQMCFALTCGMTSEVLFYLLKQKIRDNDKNYY